MSLVEEKYLEALKNMTNIQKIQRVFSLLKTTYNILEFQISKENSSLSEREIRKLVAKRLYASDPQTLKLIDGIKD